MGAFLSHALLLGVDEGDGLLVAVSGVEPGADAGLVGLEPGAGAGLTGLEPGAGAGLTGLEPGADGTEGTEGLEVILSSSSSSPPPNPLSGETGELPFNEVTLAVSSLVLRYAWTKLLCQPSSMPAQLV